MAQSPFSVNPNSAGNISAVQLRGQAEEVPQANVLQDVSQVLGAVAPFIVESHKNKLTSEVRGEIKSVELALQATRFPSLQDTLFSQEALANPVFKGALAEFTKIQDAVAQGRLPREFAIERFEAITSNAISKSPEFGAELKGAARDALGFDPRTKFMNQLLTETPQDQAMQQLQAQAFKNGLTVQEQLAINSSAARNQATIDQLNTLKAVNQYDAAAMAQETGMRVANATAEIVESALQQVQAGGIQNPDELKTLVDGIYANETNRLLSNLPANLDAGTINGHITTLNSRRDLIKSMIDNGDLQDILVRNNSVLKETAVNDLAQIPELFNIYALDPRMLPSVLGAMERFKNNPEGMKIFQRNTKEGAEQAGILSLAQRLSRGGKVLAGELNPETQEDRNAGSVVAGIALQTPGMKTEVYSNAIDKLQELTDNEVTWNTLGERRIATTVAGHKDLHGAVINIYSAEVGALQAELAALQAEGKIPDGGYKFDETGRIATTPADLLRQSIGQGGDFGAANQTEILGFANRFNRTIEVAERYKKLGVFNESLFNGGAALFQGMQDTMAEQETLPEEPTVQVWDLDENGNLFKVK